MQQVWATGVEEAVWWSGSGGRVVRVVVVGVGDGGMRVSGSQRCSRLQSGEYRVVMMMMVLQVCLVEGARKWCMSSARQSCQPRHNRSGGGRVGLPTQQPSSPAQTKQPTLTKQRAPRQSGRCSLSLALAKQQGCSSNHALPEMTLLGIVSHAHLEIHAIQQLLCFSVSSSSIPFSLAFYTPISLCIFHFHLTCIFSFPPPPCPPPTPTSWLLPARSFQMPLQCPRSIPNTLGPPHLIIDKRSKA